MTACSALLLFIYKRLLKDNIDKNGVTTFVAVTIIDFGYALLSCSKNIETAVLANNLSYFGSVLLLIEMYLVINKFCNIETNKKAYYVICSISFLILLLVLTGGTSITLYYKSIDIVIVDGVTKLIKDYGSLRVVYAIYVLFMFVLMLVIAIKSIVNKKILNSVNPIILLILVTENIIVWFFEKYARIEIELLSASYITTEAIFLMTFKNNYEYLKINTTTNKTASALIQQWKERYALTDREIEIVELLIKNTARSNIAETLCISEHTVKKHTAHIYEKLNITSRNDLLFKLNKELTD